MKRLILTLSLIVLMTGAQAQKRNKKEALPGTPRIEEALDLIYNRYVEEPDMEHLSEEAVVAMLKSLDPHSAYISAKDVQRANESLNGSFEGAGISFQIVDDTIVIGDVIEQGPSEKAGLLIGDKIITIDGLSATGDSINNTFVFNHLRGKKGTQVQVQVLRQGTLLDYTITRGKVPIYSVTTRFIDHDSIGYIALVRFSTTSNNEFRKALKELQEQGMKSLILDLRGNSGGYMEVAIQLANEFLTARKLIVYTDGRKTGRENKVSNASGHFTKGSLVVLIDEHSASASEIVSGALQDWDRATLVGRRSFGKGLVQRKFPMKDGAELRLTTARYYTPSGRCIQRSYDQGTDAYRKDLENRYRHNELVNADSNHFADSLKCKTHAGRVVYGGGGIMPDVFVPIDTMKLSDYYVAIRNKNLIAPFCQQWADTYREVWVNQGFEAYLKACPTLQLESLFATYAAEHGVVRDTALEAQDSQRTAHSDEYLTYVLRAQVARDLFGLNSYYRVMKDIDRCYLKAVELLVTGQGLVHE